MKRRTVSLGLALSLGVVGLSACSSNDAADAEAAYCEALQNLSDTVDEGRSFDAQTSVDDVKQWRTDLRDDVDAVLASGDELAEANADSISQAFDEVQSTVRDDLSAATTLGDVTDALSAGAAELRQQVDSALDAFECSTGPS